MQEIKIQQLIKKIILLGMLLAFLMIFLLVSIGMLASVSAQHTKEIKKINQKVENFEKNY